MSDLFSKRLARARKEAGYKTQKSLADKLKVSREIISRIEKGRPEREVLMGFLYQLADTLHVSPRWLATGKGTERNTGPMTDHERDIILPAATGCQRPGMAGNHRRATGRLYRQVPVARRPIRQDASR